MKLAVLTVLAYAAVCSAQTYGQVGNKVGSRVGGSIGLLTGSVIDTVPSLMGFGSKSTKSRTNTPTFERRIGETENSENEYYEDDGTVHDIEQVSRKRRDWRTRDRR